MPQINQLYIEDKKSLQTVSENLVKSLPSLEKKSKDVQIDKNADYKRIEDLNIDKNSFLGRGMAKFKEIATF